MVPILKTTLPLAARTAGATRRLVKARTRGGRWLLAGMVSLLLAMSTSAESLQTETVEPDADVVSGGDAFGKKGLIYGPEGPTNLWIGVRSAFLGILECAL